MVLNYFDISWFSSKDGPGTRVVLFLQGCNLRCPWCHSPQSWDTTPHLFFFKDRCTLCGACVEACVNNVHTIINNKHFLQRGLCKGCGKCITSCPVSRADRWNAGALGIPGSKMEVKELFRLLKPQLEMLKQIGGLTISGGEPLLQSHSLHELLGLCKAAGIHTAIETSLSVPLKNLQNIIGYVDLWLVGLRPVSSDTGMTQHWETVLKNLKFLTSRHGSTITIRTPIIPGYTDNEACFRKIADTMMEYNISSIEILPYNPYSKHYYEAGGLPYPVDETKPVGEAEMDHMCSYFSNRGFLAKIIK